ncbi:MAG: hypothetical protein HZB83_02780, partial [Deltaproteobacteria bacterium]|nr:hypothetical protein [Deltaproteobacteria bacterium]
MGEGWDEGAGNIHHPHPALPHQGGGNYSNDRGVDAIAGLRFSASIIALAFVLLTAAGCTPNNPYRSSVEDKNIFYTTFIEPPKHLDPAKAYSSDEYDLIAQIYEPPLQYHYLQRPYRLIPLTAGSLPSPAYYDRNNRRLPDNAPPEKVSRAVYEIKLKKGITYQMHPAFAKKEDGSPLYLGLAKEAVKGINGIEDFPIKGTRELISDDYMLEIMRLADPLIESPVLPIIEKYILGLKEYSELLRKDLEEIRKGRKAAAGPSYNQTVDEKENPVILDYKRHRLPGVEKVDDHAFRIILKTKYPQFVYWLAMPFFSP